MSSYAQRYHKAAVVRQESCNPVVIRIPTAKTRRSLPTSGPRTDNNIALADWLTDEPNRWRVRRRFAHPTHILYELYTDERWRVSIYRRIIYNIVTFLWRVCVCECEHPNYGALKTTTFDGAKYARGRGRWGSLTE